MVVLGRVGYRTLEKGLPPPSHRFLPLFLPLSFLFPFLSNLLTPSLPSLFFPPTSAAPCLPLYPTRLSEHPALVSPSLAGKERGFWEAL